MAENVIGGIQGSSEPFKPYSVDEARALARERFKSRYENGEEVGNCDCHSDSEAVVLRGDGPISRVAGVRFLDSGQTYFFDPVIFDVALGDWVVVETARGREAGRVVIAPHQVRVNQLQGELKPILRKLDESDVAKMNRLKRDAADAVKTFGKKIREHGLPMKPISAEYSFDGSHLTLHFSAPDRVDFRELAKDLASIYRCRIELRQIGARDEARLLGGLGRCGRTLCCSSWLPIFPEVSMNMAKTQDLPLNPQKVSGVCGRLLCCLSYENEQYRQMKSAMPRLGQPIETPGGRGMVVAMQILRDSITVRLEEGGTDVVFTAEELGMRGPSPEPIRMMEPRVPMERPQPPVAVASVEVAVTEEETSEPAEVGEETPGGGRSRSSRRRRRSRGGKSQPNA
jgi:cell fate regulator YaaT (PSP1 superfamily)